ncbi:putative ENT domain, Agenet-like domain, Agenet domain, plant type, ENT domain-like superfamily [Helianthus debilis subsp. tardiflorus]
MKFQKGSKVEVMNKTELPTSWCVAEVVSGNRDTYNLRYDCCYARVEKVSGELIRPCPPRSNDEHNWVVGDIVEVLDDSSWKTATLVCQVSDGAHFSSRPHGFSYEIVVHKSNIRARQLWQHGQWLPIISGSFGDAKMVEPKFGLQIPMPDEKLYDERDSNLLIYNDAGLHKSSRTQLKRASPFCSKYYYASNKKMNNYYADSDKCSVGSCSSRALNVESDAAESSRNEEEKGVHGLELHAYRFTLEALYASGPLSWDKEALLTNLRINLHISNDEHLEGLRNLISTRTTN